jgi:hypothetical protein
MPQFWIAIFFIILAIAQLFQSIKEIDLPFPVYLILGTILAVASNSHRKPLFDRDPQATLPEIAASNPSLNPIQNKVLTVTEEQTAID